MIPKLGPMELAIILVVVLLLFGPKNLPKLGSAIGKSMKNLREGMGGGSEKVAAPARESIAQAVEDAAVEDKPSPKHADAVEEAVVDKPAPAAATAAAK